MSSVFGWSAATSPTWGPETAEGTTAEFKAGRRHHTVGGMLKIKPEWGEVPPNWSGYISPLPTAPTSLADKSESMGAEVIKAAGNGKWTIYVSPS